MRSPCAVGKHTLVVEQNKCARRKYLTRLVHLVPGYYPVESLNNRQSDLTTKKTNKGYEHDPCPT